MTPANRILTVFSAVILSSYRLLAQAEGESPYSSSTVDEPPGGGFFNTYGLVVVCGIIFVVVIAFIFFRGRNRA